MTNDLTARLGRLQALLDEAQFGGIVGLHDCAADLIAVARAAQERCHNGHSELCTTMQPTRGCTCGHEELAAALAALEAQLP